MQHKDAQQAQACLQMATGMAWLCLAARTGSSIREPGLRAPVCPSALQHASPCTRGLVAPPGVSLCPARTSRRLQAAAVRSAGLVVVLLGLRLQQSGKAASVVQQRCCGAATGGGLSVPHCPSKRACAARWETPLDTRWQAGGITGSFVMLPGGVWRGGFNGTTGCSRFLDWQGTGFGHNASTGGRRELRRPMTAGCVTGFTQQ